MWKDGIYFWRTKLRMELKEGLLSVVQSSQQDLLLDSVCLDHDANVLHANTDLDWATCPKTRRSFGGARLRLAGGTIAYKCRFQSTIAGLSTEAEFIWLLMIL
jgi:hypothetical protein